MASILKVDTIQDQDGNNIISEAANTITIGASGDTITIPSGATLANSGIVTGFQSTGFDDNATSTAITINSSQNVGIGTSSPDADLTISSGGGEMIHLISSHTNKAHIEAEAGNGSMWRLGTLDSNPHVRLEAMAVTGEIKFLTGGTNERMRIDDSGNLLVNKTALDNSVEGFSVGPDNYVTVVRDGGRTMILNRKTSDGQIVEFRKDGTAVGSINARAGDLTIGTGITGITFSDSIDAIRPVKVSDDNLTDNTTDIGSSANRFQDLYLGGGLYVGGTGTANKLDDYEEGTWTPTLSSGTCTVISAKYTKIGNQCTLHFHLANFSDSSTAADVIITGIPFTQPSNTESGIGSAFGERTDVNKPTLELNANNIRFRNGFGVSNFDTPLQYSDINDGADLAIIASVTYETA